MDQFEANSIRNDAYNAQIHDDVNKWTSPMCHNCEYKEIRNDGEYYYANCVVTDEECPGDKNRICPVVLKCLTLFFGSYCVNSCGAFVTADFEEIICPVDDCPIQDRIDNYMNITKCNHEKNITYIEKEFEEGYKKVTLCLVCGEFKINDER